MSIISFPILALAIASFGIGTTEFVIVGLLPDLAHSFGVTVPKAGYLVSGYAMGVVIGAPVVAIATAGLPRKIALIGLMVIFLAGNFGCALAPTYSLLMAARVLTAFAHGAFFGIGAVVAQQLVKREHQTQAVAVMFAGLTIATVLGVPLGTALGHAEGWRASFWAIVVIGFVALMGIISFVPSGLPGSQGGVVSEFRTLGRWPVLLPMIISTISSVSLFSVFTYVTPLLEQVTGLTPQAVTIAFLAIGLGLTCGNLLGGKFADQNLMATIVASFFGLILALLGLFFAIRLVVPAIVLLSLWAAIAFSLVSPLQIWVVEAAKDAPNLASTLNQGAFNLGNATGAWVGGAALTLGVRYNYLPLIGIVPAIIGLALTFVAIGRADGIRATT